MQPVLRRDLAIVISWAVAATATAGPPVAQDVLPVTKQPQIVIDGRGFIGTPIETLAVSSDGDMIAAGADKVVRVWTRRVSPRGGAPLWELTATLRGYQEPMGYETGKVHSLRFSPDDRFLLVGVADNSLAGATRVFDLRDPRQMHGVIPGHLACTRGITFSPDGKHLATWSCDGQLIVYAWQAAKGTATELFRDSYLSGDRGDPEDAGAKVDVPPCFSFLDDDQLAFSGVGVPVRVYSVRTGKLLPQSRMPARLKAAAARMKEMATPSLRGRVVETCSPFVAFAALERGAAGPWYAKGGMAREGAGQATYFAAVLSAGDKAPVVYTKHAIDPVAIACASLSPVVASSDMLGHVHLWDRSTGRQIAVLRPGARPIWSLSWTDPTRFTIGDRFYEQDEGYQFNHRGPPTHLLDVAQMALTPLPSAARSRKTAGSPSDASVVAAPGTAKYTLSMKRVENPAWEDYLHREVFGLHVTDGRGKTTPFGYPEPKVDVGAGKAVEPVVPHTFRVPTDALHSVSAYAFIDDPSVRNRNAHCLIGTRSGEFYECEIVADGEGGYSLRACREFLGHSTVITSISMSPDGTKCATSSLDGTVRIWRLTPPRVLADIPTERDSKGSCLACGGGGVEGFVAQKVYHRFDGVPFFERYRKILSGAYSPGDKVVIGSAELTLGADGRFTVSMEEKEETLEPSRDLAEPLMSFYFSNDGEWVAWTQEGYYTSSFGGAEHVGFHVNRDREELAEFFPARTFAAAFERPGLVVATLLGRTSPEAPAPAFAVATLAGTPRTTSRPVSPAEGAFVTPPTPTIVSPDGGSAIDAGGPCRVEIEVRSHPDRPLRRLAVQIDDVGSRLVTRRTSVDTPRPDLTVERYEAVLDATPGGMTLTAIATHDLGATRSDPLRVTVRGGPAGGGGKPRLFVLAVGVAAYRDPALRLEAADRDAERFAESMERQRGGFFTDVQVRTLIDSRATRDGIEDGLEWIAGSCDGSEDVAVVLLSGHGLVDDGNEWYFAPAEVDRARIARTAVSRADFEKYLRPLRRLIVFTDTSRRPAAGPAPVAVASDAGIVSPFRSSGTPSFHACAMGNVSRDEASQGIGVFAKAIVDALGQPAADANRDGLIQVAEVRDFVERQVSAATKGRQNPLFEAPATVGSLVIGRYADR